MAVAQQSMALLMLISAIPMAGLAAYAIQNRDEPGARGFILCQIGMAGWTVQLALITWPTELMAVFLNTTIRHAFQYFVILGWPLFVWEYIRRDTIQFRRSHIVAILVIPITTVLLTATNPLHYLVLARETPTNPAGISEFILGPWYLVHIGFAVTLVMIPGLVLARDWHAAHGVHRRQLRLMLSGWALGFPGALNTHLFRNIESVPSYIDIAPFTFIAATGFWALALYRYRLFNLVPISRRTAVETMNDPVISLDRHDSVVDANPAACEVFGISDPAGMDANEIFSAHPTILEEYTRISEAGVGQFEDEDHSSGADELLETVIDDRSFSLGITPIQRGHAWTGLLVVLREITELKAREQELRRTNHQLDQFAGFVSHDLRNPLGIAQTYLTFAEDSGDPADFDAVRQSHDRMYDMINGMLTLTKVDSQTLERRENDLETVAREAWSGFETQQLSLHIEATCAIVADSDHLHHVFANLYSNVVEHGTSATTVTVGPLESDAGFYVEDDGVGIPESNREAILEQGTSTKVEGTGLGLSIVGSIVDVHGWEICVEESESGGARFEIRTATESVAQKHISIP